MQYTRLSIDRYLNEDKGLLLIEKKTYLFTLIN